MEELFSSGTFSEVFLSSFPSTRRKDLCIRSQAEGKNEEQEERLFIWKKEQKKETADPLEGKRIHGSDGFSRLRSTSCHRHRQRDIRETTDTGMRMDGRFSLFFFSAPKTWKTTDARKWCPLSLFVLLFSAFEFFVPSFLIHLSRRSRDSGTKRTHERQKAGTAR